MVLISKKYSCKDVTMLLATKLIALNFKDYIAELSVVNNKWTTDYADDLFVRIDNIIKKHLGVDAKVDLRKSTSSLNSLIVKVCKDLADFKLLLETLFKNDVVRKREIINDLGFKHYYKDVLNKKQEAVINLLYAFKTNMTDDLRAELNAKGVQNNLVDSLVANADIVEAANDEQENCKFLSKEISFNKRVLFNSLYDEVIIICRLASSYYKNLPVKKAMFTFSKVAKHIVKKQKSENS